MNATITIENIIQDEAITAYYQPIVSLHNGEIFGYEALSRGPENTEFFSPIALIEAAETHDCLWELEMLFRRKAIEKSVMLHPRHTLFLNVDPNVIRDPAYKSGFTKSYLEQYHIQPSKIIFEITERTAIKDFSTFNTITKHYRDQSYMLAIDDVGSGYSNLRSIIELKPDFVKIDMDLIRDLDSDSFKQAMIKALVTMAKDTGTKLIAEGVETTEELKTLIELDVHMAQGYLIHRPDTHVHSEIPQIRNLILDYNHQHNNMLSKNADYYVVGKLAKTYNGYDSTLTCSEIKAMFSLISNDSLCLLSDDGYPEGIIMKKNLNSRLADRYGYDLYANRPVRLLMESQPLIIDYYTPVTQVIELAMQRKKDQLYDDLIVTKDSRYYGLVTMFDIITYTTEYEKLYAKQMNPLTYLPGNVIIRQVIEQHIMNQTIVGLMYLDLDFFKSYNDVYGFEAGDEFLKATGKFIQETTLALLPEAFIGHIGGDDFFILVSANYEELRNLSQKITLGFPHIVREHFSKEDYARGCIEFMHHGKPVCTPITSISIAAYYGTLTSFGSPELLGKFMGGIKGQVKAKPGNQFLIITESMSRQYI